MKHFILFSVLIILSSCSTIHKPAKIIPGYNLGITGSAYVTPDGNIFKGNVLESNGHSVMPDGQLEFGYGFKESHIYTGIKIPVAVMLANFDVYYQWLDEDKWSLGTGLELGYLMGAYGILGYSINPDMEIGIGNKFSAGLFGQISFPDSTPINRPLIYDLWLQYWITLNTWAKFGIDSGMSFHRSNQTYPYTYNIVGFNPNTFHASLSVRFNF